MALFDGDRPLRVAALFSGGASGVRYLREHDPNHGDAYEVVGAVASDPDADGVEHLRDAGVEVVVRDLRAFYADRDADTGDMDVRAEFDAGTADRIADFDPDLVVLSGYMWILTAPVLERYPVLNVHPADLLVTADGERAYTGADAVYDAVTDGREHTRSSVHVVTAAVDDGPVLVRSRPLPVATDLVADLRAAGADDAVRSYADAHQEWMKWAADGPALATALDLVAAGDVELHDDGATVAGAPAPYDLG